jgi:hypothetical protein
MALTKIIEGGIDIHTHSSPSLFPRKMNDWEMIEQAKSRNLGGIVIKSHESSTVDRALVLQMKEPNLIIQGGIVLNYFIGGLNPYAVEVALKMGGKFIWLPTISSEQHMSHYRGNEGNLFQGIDEIWHPKEGISILNGDGSLKEAMFDIIDLVKKYDGVLCTGHISEKEVMVLSEIVCERKLEKFVITHPDMGIAPISIENQKKLSKRGAYLEKCFLATTESFMDLTVAEMAETIKILDPVHCLLVTDFGQAFNDDPISAMSDFIQMLIDSGINEQSIRKMYVENPVALVK